MLDMKNFHAGRDHFYGILSDGTKVTDEDLRNWIQIDLINGGKTVYMRRNVFYQAKKKEPTEQTSELIW